MAKSDVSNIPTFGEVAAEDDAILEYFVQTDSVNTVANGIKFLILGRKGSGKTALFRYFNERQPSGSLSLVSRAVSSLAYSSSHSALPYVPS